jgi:nitrite reductase/ring-hydroxylating ferredoxin subunit
MSESTHGEKEFVPVARLDEIPPGETLRVEIGAAVICLANVEGHIFAVDDECPHLGAALSEGELTGCALTCPVHLSRFDVRDGHVLRGPACEEVLTHPVRVEGEQIYVAPEPDAVL